MCVRIRFSYNPTWYNRLIKLFTWYSYTHVDVEETPGMYIGALPNSGVVFHCKKARDEKFMTIDTDKEKVLSFMRAQLGKGYDWRGILGLGFNINKQDNSKWFCSELIGAAIQYADPTKISIQPHKLTPRDIALICKDE